MLYILKIHYWNDGEIELNIFNEEDLQDIYNQLDNKKFLEIHKRLFWDTGLFMAANPEKCDMILINVDSIIKIELTDVQWNKY